MLLGLKNSADIEKEVKILTTLQHPHILRLLDFYDEEEHYFMVLELVSGGDLFDRVVHQFIIFHFCNNGTILYQVHKQQYSESDARNLFLILVHAVQYCHQNNIIHRDLKPENVLMKTLDDDIDIKLADFGFASKRTYVTKY